MLSVQSGTPQLPVPIVTHPLISEGGQERDAISLVGKSCRPESIGSEMLRCSAYLYPIYAKPTLHNHLVLSALLLSMPGNAKLSAKLLAKLPQLTRVRNVHLA